MKKYTIPFLIFISVISFHCGITQPVRVLQEKETRITSSLGGTLIPLGILVPAPYLNIGAMYGFSESITGVANLHFTSLMYGTAGIDVGAATSLTKEQNYIPEITTQAKLTFFSDITRKNIFRLYPSLTVNGSYSVGKTLLYFGADNWYQIHKPLLLISPFVGSQFDISDNMFGQVEVKWIGANYYNPHGVFQSAAAINGYGSVGVYFGIQYQLE